jgi:hypothetical protein
VKQLKNYNKDIAMGFNKDAALNKIKTDSEKTKQELASKFGNDFSSLAGLTTEQLTQFGGSTEDASALIAEVEKATAQNLSQAQFVSNVKNVGGSVLSLLNTIKGFVLPY